MRFAPFAFRFAAPGALFLVLAGATPPSAADCGSNNEHCLIGQPGDLDLDGDVGVGDLAVLATCLTGPGDLVPQPWCGLADLNLDGDIDLFDLADFQVAYTGECSCPPNATAPETLIDATPYLGEAPLIVTFDASRSSDAEALIVSYDWDFGDGNVDSGVSVQHMYITPGDYTVTLTATDAGGLASQATLVVTVSDGTYTLSDPVSANEARRFLWQAAFGPDPNSVNFIVQNGYEAWLDAQFLEPTNEILWSYLLEYEARGYGYTHPSFAWDDICIEGADQLRQRAAWALIQIIVNNMDDNTTGPQSNSWYYSEYLNRALGNYRDLLDFVTHSHQMGIYLTYMGNHKADPSTGSEPDENYARELLQLFTIGLWELNLDGTRLLDGQGLPIPTYGNVEVQQYARVFTGLEWNYDIYWEDSPRTPMLMEWWWHEFGDKQLLDYPGAVPTNGYIAALTDPNAWTSVNALQDVQLAIDNAFWHPNVAPFISHQLIQRFVTSNPTPAYVQRVATAFEGGGPYGGGQRGDLFATLKAVLLDDEARDPAYRSNPLYGKVREPIVVRWALYRLLERVDRPGETFPYRIDADVWSTRNDFGQALMQAPSVFNFYGPDYRPPGTAVADMDRVAPELRLYNDSTAMAMIDRFRYDLVTPDGTAEAGRYADWRLLASSPTALVDALDDELMFGALSTEARQIIETAVGQITGDTERVRAAVWLIVNSPEFRVLR